MLYNKYRPKDFKGLKGQEHLQEVFLSAFKYRESFPHSLLFVGERGTGKTTSARIWARLVNCENPSENGPCGCCRYCREIEEGNMDIIEFDAASNRSVDNIRALKERLQVVSTIPNRVLIIDEVHMLSNEAFNALLLTLEEPPEKTFFILCTTEVHKVPATIISRCARFIFRPMDLVTISSHLAYVCEQEKLPYELDALNLIAQNAKGSMRDALSILEQLSVMDLTEENVRTALGHLPEELLLSMALAILTNDMKSCFDVLGQVESLGTSATFIDSMISLLVDYAAIKSGAEISNSAEYICNLKKLPDCNCKLIFDAVRKLSQVRNAGADMVSVKAAILNIISSSVETDNQSLMITSIEDLYDRVIELEEKMEVVNKNHNTVIDSSDDNCIIAESEPIKEKNGFVPDNISTPFNENMPFEAEPKKDDVSVSKTENSAFSLKSERVGSMSAKGIHFFDKSNIKKETENQGCESKSQTPKNPNSFIEDMMKRMYGI